MDSRPVRVAFPRTPCVDAPGGQRVGRRAKRAARPAPDKRKRAAFRQPSTVPAKTRNPSMQHPPRTEPSGATSPSVEGLPRQGRGEAGKGRGPRVATQRVGRRAKRAARPAPDKRKRAAFRQPSTVPAKTRNPSMQHPQRTEPSGATSPSVEGLPRQGRGEAGKGRGPQVAQQRVGRRAKRAARPAPDKRKRAAFRQPFFFYLAERGGFEPPRRYKRLPDFESGTFNHSATSPGGPRRTGDAHHTRK